jgi:dihydroflavonol-4-reductase
VRCLVTGATGLVGGRLAHLLVARRHYVRCLVRKTSVTSHLASLPIEYVVGDVLQPESLTAAVDGVDWVFHVAGITKARDADEFRRANAGGASAILDACARRGSPPSAVVVVSSLAAAGPSRDGHPVREDEPPCPITPYGVSKHDAETIAEGFADRLSLALIRPPAVYGPRDRELLPLFQLASLGIVPRLPGLHALSLVHVDDLARGLVAAAEGVRPGARIYNIAHPEILDMADVLAMIGSSSRRWNVAVPVPTSVMALAASALELDTRIRGHAHVFDRHKVLDMIQRGWVCSVDRAREELGFEAAIDARRGIAQTAAWYRDSDWL